MTREKKLTHEEIVRHVLTHTTGKVKLAVTDIDGVLRGKYVHRDKFLSIVEEGFGFCDVIFGWDVGDQGYEGANYTGWHTGFPDAKASIDLNTFREVPWDNNVPFFLADFSAQARKSPVVCPRFLLKMIKERAEKKGYKATFAQEFEWFNFEETPESLEQKGHMSPTPLTPGMYGYSILRASRNNQFFNDLFELLESFGIPLEGLHTETGPGVYEGAIVYSDILEAADRAALFKTSVKEIGMRHGIIPSFMAKWNEKLPGCGGHLHQSLWDKTGRMNVFYDEKDRYHMSEVMKSYLAGQLHCLPQILPFYAPTINSYKRLVEGAWAPTTLTWGVDNRTTAIRVLPGSPSSTRLEFRVPGSDVNPYLAMAACLASGLYGIEKNLSLDREMTKGNGYRDYEKGSLPRTLDEATKIMRESKLANELFGEVFVQHFAQTREWEWKQHLKAVTDWELKRYFEII